MNTKSLKISITNIFAQDGCYTAPIYVGSERVRVNVFLDTGSSTLAISQKHYDPSMDSLMKTTNLAQSTLYGDNSFWKGALINTRVIVKHEDKNRQLSDASVSIVVHEEGMFKENMQGILGFGYKDINYAYIFKKPTWPKFDYKNMESKPWTTIRPYFTQLEKKGITPNKFAFYTLRSELHFGKSSLAKDPLNNGYCVLGGGEEYTDLYSGRFKSAKVLHDVYYNTNITSVRVGKTDPIKVKPSTKSSGLNSNSIVDSGTSDLYFPDWLYNKMLAQFKKLNPSYIQDINQSKQTDDIKLTEGDVKKWPNIYISLEGESRDIELKITPQNYWQVNCTEDGVAYFAIGSQGKQGENQTILGLPFMNNFYCVFDRSAENGLGGYKIRQNKTT